MLRLPVSVYAASGNCHENLKAQKRAKLRKINKNVRKLADTLDEIAKKDFELTKEIISDKAEKDMSSVKELQMREPSIDLFD